MSNTSSAATAMIAFPQPTAVSAAKATEVFRIPILAQNILTALVIDDPYSNESVKVSIVDVFRCIRSCRAFKTAFDDCSHLQALVLLQPNNVPTEIATLGRINRLIHPRPDEVAFYICDEPRSGGDKPFWVILGETETIPLGGAYIVTRISLFRTGAVSEVPEGYRHIMEHLELKGESVRKARFADLGVEGHVEASTKCLRDGCEGLEAVWGTLKTGAMVGELLEWFKEWEGRLGDLEGMDAGRWEAQLRRELGDTLFDVYHVGCRVHG